MVVKCDASLRKNLAQVVSDIASTNWDLNSCMRDRITFKYWHNVRDALTRVYNNTGGSSRGEKGEHCLDVKIEIRDVEGIEHDLSDSLTVSFGVQ